MIERRLTALVLAAALAGVSLAAAPPAPAAELTIGYLQLKKDARYSSKRTYARFLGEPLGRPYLGARVAIAESKFVGSAVGVTFTLEREKVRDAADAVETLSAMNDAGVGFFVTDLPAQVLAEVAKGTRGRPLVLLNISARQDRLRGQRCQAHLLHVVPSHAMLSDAIAQYLVSRKWREVLLLEGPLAEDREIAAAFSRSAKRMGLKIADRRTFVLSNDPRERDRNNVALLTAGEDYDVVFVADSVGEFARNVPFHTVLPRPVAGSEGLAAAAWHWAWERHGAPQLEGRFVKEAGRPMGDYDWAAWMAVKAVVEAVVRSESSEFATVRDFLRGEAIILDGFKGHRMNFRPWDGQLRQPILLITHNWVVDRAPMKGFLHPINNLDTLGFEERDGLCKP